MNLIIKGRKQQRENKHSKHEASISAMDVNDIAATHSPSLSSLSKQNAVSAVSHFVHNAGCSLKIGGKGTNLLQFGRTNLKAYLALTAKEIMMPNTQ